MSRDELDPRRGLLLAAVLAALALGAPARAATPAGPLGPQAMASPGAFGAVGDSWPGGSGAPTGGGALLIGTLCTVVPTAAGALMMSANPSGTAGTSLVLAGVTLGPAVGLFWGGRRDLAGRGLEFRTAALGTAASCVMLAGLTAVSGEGDSSADTFFTLAAIFAGVAGASAVYDLAITPSAVDAGPHASLGVRADGRLAVHVAF